MRNPPSPWSYPRIHRRWTWSRMIATLTSRRRRMCHWHKANLPGMSSAAEADRDPTLRRHSCRPLPGGPYGDQQRRGRNGQGDRNREYTSTLSPQVGNRRGHSRGWHPWMPRHRIEQGAAAAAGRTLMGAEDHLRRIQPASEEATTRVAQPHYHPEFMSVDTAEPGSCITVSRDSISAPSRFPHAWVTTTSSSRARVAAT